MLNVGSGTVPLWGGGAGFPFNTMCPGPRPTCKPSFILIHQPFGRSAPTLQTDGTGQIGQTDRQTDRERTEPKTVHPTLSDRLSALSATLVHCGQTVGWIGMPLGTKVGLRPGHIVLDVDPAPTWGPSSPSEAQQTPLFGPRVLSPNGRASQQLLSSCYGRPM